MKSLENKIHDTIAEKLMGWKSDLEEYYCAPVWVLPNGKIITKYSWNPSLNAKHAFDIVKYLTEHDYRVDIRCSDSWYEVTVSKDGAVWLTEGCDTVNKAICNTALAVAGYSLSNLEYWQEESEE